MPKSRLHQLSELGQSVWIDSLSRGWLKDGELARMMSEDAVVGVTSNPTIFQKAMAEGEWYDDQLREVVSGVRRHEGDLPPARRGGHQGRVRPLPPGLGRDRWDGRVRLAGGRSQLRVRDRGDDRRGDPLPRLDRSSESPRQDPGHAAGPARDRRDDRAGPQHQRDADLLSAAPPGGRRGLHPGARAARRGRRRSVDGRIGRELLRLAGRHRGGPAAGRGRASRS